MAVIFMTDKDCSDTLQHYLSNHETAPEAFHQFCRGLICQGVDIAKEEFEKAATPPNRADRRRRVYPVRPIKNGRAVLN